MRKPEGQNRGGAPRRSSGFSLIEIMVVIAVISILAGAMAPIGLQQITAARTKATRSSLRQLSNAMTGDSARGDFGYLGDMGGLPATLEDLNSAAGKPAYQIAPPGIGFGYNGPYVATLRLGTAGRFVDAWDMPFSFNRGGAQVTSLGPDRVLGNADDLSWPPAPLAIRGTLLVRVLGVPNTGDPASPLANADADVFVSLSNDGRLQEVRMVDPASGPGPWSVANLAFGHHGVRVVGRGGYAGAAQVRDVVSTRSGTAVITLTLAQP